MLRIRTSRTWLYAIGLAVTVGLPLIAAAGILLRPDPAVIFSPVADGQSRFDGENLLPSDNLCGPRAVATVALLEGIPFNIDKFIAICPLTPDGISMLDLKDAAQRAKFTAEARKLSWNELLDLKRPAILFVSDSHYVAVDPRDKTSGDGETRIRLFNPPRTASYISESELSPVWRGETLILRRESPSPASGQPMIAFDRLLQDFGTQEADQSVSCRFYYTNRGTSDVKIEHVEKSCGCTAAGLSVGDTPPGGRGYISVSLDLHGRTGNQTQSVSVFTNDPANPQIDLIYQGFAERKFYVDRDRIEFTNLTRGMVQSSQIFVENRSSHSMKIKSTEVVYPMLPAEANPVQFQASALPPARGPKSPFESASVNVKAEVSSEAGFSNYGAILRIIIDAGDLRTIEIPISASVIPDYQAMPESISFGVVRPGMKVTRRISLIKVKKDSLGAVPPVFSCELTAKSNSNIVPTITQTGTEDGNPVYEATLSIPGEFSTSTSTIGDGLIRFVGADGQELIAKYSYLQKGSPS